MLVYFFLFIFGLIVGSFINVLTLRYKPENRIFDFKIIDGRSHCMNCQKKLSWLELIPIVSFLMQKGKCRNCGNKISWQYPLVEFLSGLIFVAVPYYLSNFYLPAGESISNFQFNGYHVLIVAAIWVFIFLSFLVLSVIDFRHYIIPDSINLFLFLAGAVLMILNYNNFSIFDYSFIGRYALLFDIGFLKVSQNILFNHIFATAVALVFIGLIIIISKGTAMGWGDFKLAGALAMIFGWPDIVLVLSFAFIVGSIAVLPLLIKRRKTMKDVVPFGPFLIIGASLVFFYGFALTDLYFRLFRF